MNLEFFLCHLKEYKLLGDISVISESQYFCLSENFNNSVQKNMGNYFSDLLTSCIFDISIIFSSVSIKLGTNSLFAK